MVLAVGLLWMGKAPLSRDTWAGTWMEGLGWQPCKLVAQHVQRPCGWQVSCA